MGIPFFWGSAAGSKGCVFRILKNGRYERIRNVWQWECYFCSLPLLHVLAVREHFHTTIPRAWTSFFPQNWSGAHSLRISYLQSPSCISKLIDLPYCVVWDLITLVGCLESVDSWKQLSEGLQQSKSNVPLLIYHYQCITVCWDFLVFGATSRLRFMVILHNNFSIDYLCSTF